VYLNDSKGMAQMKFNFIIHWYGYIMRIVEVIHVQPPQESRKRTSQIKDIKATVLPAARNPSIHG
jgi:hypothetical protein